MAYTNFTNCTAEEYKNIVYSQETKNKIKILFNNVELQDADEYCESLEVISRIIPTGSKVFMLSNLVSKEATLILHNIDTSIIQDQVSISIGTVVSSTSLGDTYEYVPIGIFNIQEKPTTDKDKTTIKLRDNTVKLDFDYNAKPLIDLNGGSATKKQILDDICSQAGITNNVSTFLGSTDLIGIYDNTIRARQYVSWLAEQAGALPIITRTGALDFVYLNNLTTNTIPLEIVEKYENGDNFKISRVVYEDAIRKYESGNETYDTLFLDSANPYVSSQAQVDSIKALVNNFEINSYSAGRILGNPAIDPYDLIQITDDNTTFTTFANNTLRYNGKLTNTFDSIISLERKQENVTLNSNQTFKNYAKTSIDNLNAEITIQAGKVEEIENEIQNTTSTKEGTFIDIDDALDQPLIDFSLKGDTQQDTTTGKNKFNYYSYPVTEEKNGVTCTNNGDGTFTLNGTATVNNFSFSLGSANEIKQYSQTQSVTHTAYYISGSCEKGSNTSTRPVLRLDYNHSASFIHPNELSSSNTSISKTLPSRPSSTGFSWAINIGIGDKFNNLKIKYQVELGNAATEYEPYTGGIPSPNPDYPQEVKTVTGRQEIDICGKNLFIPTLTNNGVNIQTAKCTATLNGDEYTLTATGSNMCFGIVANSGNIYENRYGTLYSIGNATKVYLYLTNSTFNKNYINWYDENKISLGYLSIQSSSGYKDVPENAKYFSIRFGYGNATSGTTYTTKVMVSYNEITEYEPYTNQNYKIDLPVENLIEPKLESAEYNGITCTRNNDGSYTLNGTATDNCDIRLDQSTRIGVDNLKTLKAGTYTLSCNDLASSLELCVMQNETWTKLLTMTGNTPVTQTIETSNNLFTYVYIPTGTELNNLVIHPMLEKGDKANQYTPYGTTPIELCKIGNYQDYIYKDNGSWYIHKEIGKVVLNGSENGWGVSGTIGTNYRHNISKTNLNITSLADYNIFSNYFTKLTGNVGTWGTANLGGSYLIFHDKDGIYDNSQFKTWLSTHNTIVYYVLASPTYTKITNTELIGQLSTLMSNPLFKGINHITVDTFNLNPTLYIEYYLDTALNENFVGRDDMSRYYTRVETDAQIKVSSDSIEQDVSRITSNISSTEQTHYQEMLSKMDEKASISDIETVTSQVNTLQTDTYKKTEIQTILSGVNDLGAQVKYIQTASATFDEDGMHYAKSGSQTSSTINEVGVAVNDKSNSELLFAGYDTATQQALVRVANLYLTQFLGLDDWRAEIINDSTLGKGIGFFYIG